MIDKDGDDDENWVDPGGPSGGRSRHTEGNVNDKGENMEDTPGGEKWHGKGNGAKDSRGDGKVTEDGKGKGKGEWKATEKGTERGRETVKGNVL